MWGVGGGGGGGIFLWGVGRWGGGCFWGCPWVRGRGWGVELKGWWGGEWVGDFCGGGWRVWEVVGGRLPGSGSMVGAAGSCLWGIFVWAWMGASGWAMEIQFTFSITKVVVRSASSSPTMMRLFSVSMEST